MSEQIQTNEPPLLYEVAQGVATLTLNRPDKLNAFNDEMVQRCLASLQEAQADDAVRAVILTGAGRGFCAGADVGRMGQDVQVTPSGVRQRLKTGLQRIPKLLLEFDKPLIAAINGVATGAGMDLAMMCDVRYAASSVRMAQTYARLGLVPGAGGAWLLPRMVGAAKALELLWGGGFVEADEALRLGLVNAVYPDDELQERTRTFARSLADAPPLSIRLIKRAVYQGLQSDFSSSLELISSYLAIARTSADQAEAMAAYKEKRPGKYQGR